MNSILPIEMLKEKIGCQNREMPHLPEAFTHRSYAKENHLTYDNQRLEFLGDAVLEIALTDYLFQLRPVISEGDMTKLRAALVRESTLAEISRELNFGDYLLTGKGEQLIDGAHRDSTLADLLEAILGAIYLDAGLEAARNFLMAQLSSRLQDPYQLIYNTNPKGQLQELTQKRFGATPHYQVVRISGPEHLPTYEVEVTLDRYIALGSGTNRKNAECDAARRLFLFLEKEEKNEL